MKERRPSIQSSEDFLAPGQGEKEEGREEGRKYLKPSSLIVSLPTLSCFNLIITLSVLLHIREAVLLARSLEGAKWGGAGTLHQVEVQRMSPPCAVH